MTRITTSNQLKSQVASNDDAPYEDHCWYLNLERNLGTLRSTVQKENGLPVDRTASRALHRAGGSNPTPTGGAESQWVC